MTALIGHVTVALAVFVQGHVITASERSGGTPMGMTRADAETAATRRRRFLQYIAERPLLWQDTIGSYDADGGDEDDDSMFGARMRSSMGASHAPATMALRPRPAGGAPNRSAVAVCEHASSAISFQLPVLWRSRACRIDARIHRS